MSNIEASFVPSSEQNACDIPSINVDTATQLNVSISNTTSCVEDYKQNFIKSDLSDEFLTFIDDDTGIKWNKESGRSVCNYGELYQYVGSKQPDDLKTFPNVIKKMSEKIVENTITQCTINKFEGPDSYLPSHSVNEKNS